MLAPKSEVWHRKGFAVQPNGFSPGFRHGGEVYKPGASTIIRTNWQWTIKGEKQSAFARLYAAFVDPGRALIKSEQRYGLLVGLGWLLDFAVLSQIDGHQE